MAEVHPITNQEDIDRIYKLLTKWDNVREAELFIIGCHIGLRIGDLLKLTFDDVANGFLMVTEEKTKKKRVDIPVNDIFKESVLILKAWYAEKNKYIKPIYLFQSIGRNVSEPKPIDATHFRRIFKEATTTIGLEGNYSSHSLRKTFGYQNYIKTGDLTQIQKVFNHATQGQTLDYIGVTRITQQKMYMELKLINR